MASYAFYTVNDPNVSEPLTNHARRRMSGRSINEWQIDQVLNYGRATHSRKAVIYTVGRREVKEFGRFLEPCEGIHVLCSPQNGAVISGSGQESRGSVTCWEERLLQRLRSGGWAC